MFFFSKTASISKEIIMEEYESEYNVSYLVDGLSNMTNFSTNSSMELPEEAPFPGFPIGFQISAHIIYNLVMVFGLIGNGCVLLIFTLRKRPFRKFPTPLLANLAVADLLITVFCLETGYLLIIWQYWPFGKFLCFALSPVKPIGVFVSCYTLIALSVDRYLGVKNPLQIGVLSKEKVKWTIIVIWILAISTSFPIGFYTTYEIHHESGLPRCGEYAWKSETDEMIYDLVLICLQFFIPVVVLLYTYTRISIVVWKNRSLRHRLSQGTSPRQKGLRTIRMSMMVVFGYVFAWLPLNVATLLHKYNDAMGESDTFPYFFVGCHLLAMSHSVYNPIIYFWLNESFRTTALELFCSKKMLERRRLDSALFSWRTSGAYASNVRTSSVNGGRRTSGGRTKLASTSESAMSFPVSPLVRLPQNSMDQSANDEEIMIVHDDTDFLTNKNDTKEALPLE